MTTYYAVTTENAQMTGWEIYAIAGSRAAALAAAEAKIGPSTDIHEQTRRLNLRVWSRSAARRLVGPAQLDYMLDAYFQDREAEAEEAARWPRISDEDIYGPTPEED